MSKETHPNWPLSAVNAYDPIRPLGSGGFGSVWLASKKGASADDDPDFHVAVKLLGSGDKTKTIKVEAAYARREVTILSELSHPGIVRLVRTFGADVPEQAQKDIPSSSSPEVITAPTCIALSYARGPTLEQLLLHGGALGLHMARVVAAQLVDAVAYLHGRGVIHRDIKPDNCIVTGAVLSDGAVYSDGTEGENAAREGRWRTTLIDFGFARALHPSEVDVDIGLYKTVHDVGPEDVREENIKPGMLPSIDAPLEDGSGKGKRGRRSSLDKSVSRTLVRDLSALGNRSYAAPEIVQKARRYEGRTSELGISKSGHGLDQSGRSRRSVKSWRKPLAECVSDYGMVADAFSLGATIRYMLTGVPPQFAVDDFMAMRNNPVAVAARAVGRTIRKMRGKAKKTTTSVSKRKKRYKGNDKVPKDAAQLVRALTHWDHNKRTTVRAARLYPWIYPTPYVDVDDAAEEPALSLSGGKVDFLRCALEEEADLGVTEPEKNVINQEESHVSGEEYA